MKFATGVTRQSLSVDQQAEYDEAEICAKEANSIRKKRQDTLRARDGGVAAGDRGGDNDNDDESDE